MTRFFMLVVLLAVGLNTYAATSLQQVTSEFERRLEQSQKKLQSIADQLHRQQQPRLNELRKLESQLMNLRQQLAGYTRSSDEQFVSIQALQKRLGEWQQQSRYIDNLLQGYLGFNENGEASNIFNQKLNNLSRSSQPQWQKAKVIGLDGRMLTGQQLTVGPLSWFMDDRNNGYIADISNHPVVLVMDSPSSLENIHAFPVDISQDKAIRIAASHNSWFSKLAQGGIWVYPIFLLGLVALFVVIYKLHFLFRLAGLQQNLAEQAVAGIQPQANSWQQSLFVLAQNHRHWPEDALADKLHHQLLQWKAVLDSKMVILTATAAVAPLLGLLGTVSGMIQTFDMMNLFGNQDQNMLAGGISEALVTTELGLMVAVPVLLIHAYIHRRHQAYLAQLEADAVLYGQLSTEGREAS